MLLGSDAGHFSMVKLVSRNPLIGGDRCLLLSIYYRALHLADLVTELNGKEQSLISLVDFIRANLDH